MSAATRRWGWHQLSDTWARRVVHNAGVGPGDLVIDIGAGTGALTAHLVAAGAKVIAVEAHRQRANALRERFANDAVTIVRADAADLRLPRQPFSVVANPPFALTTAIIRRLLAPGSRLVRADLVVPRQAAYRWTSAGAPGSGRWDRDFAITRTTRLPTSAFRPPPPSDAAIVVLARRATTIRGQKSTSRRGSRAARSRE